MNDKELSPSEEMSKVWGDMSEEERSRYLGLDHQRVEDLKSGKIPPEEGEKQIAKYFKALAAYQESKKTKEVKEKGNI